MVKVEVVEVEVVRLELENGLNQESLLRSWWDEASHPCGVVEVEAAGWWTLEAVLSTRSESPAHLLSEHGYSQCGSRACTLVCQARAG